MFNFKHTWCLEIRCSCNVAKPLKPQTENTMTITVYMCE